MNEIEASTANRQTVEPQGATGADLLPQGGPVGRAQVDEQQFDAQQLHDLRVAVVRGGFTPREAVTIPQGAYFEE